MLVPNVKACLPLPEETGPHAEHATVEVDGPLYVGHGKDEVVKPVDAQQGLRGF